MTITAQIAIIKIKKGELKLEDFEGSSEYEIIKEHVK